MIPPPVYYPPPDEIEEIKRDYQKRGGRLLFLMVAYGLIVGSAILLLGLAALTSVGTVAF